MQNGLQLNPDKSEALIVGTSSQLTSTSALSSVSVAGVDRPVADEMKVLGVALDRRLSSTVVAYNKYSPEFVLPSTY